jgi:multimeric flavodoxin WrbA
MSKFFRQFNPLYEQEDHQLNVVVLLGTLKKNLDKSTTVKLVKEVEKHMPDAKFDFVHLATMKIDVGTTINVDTSGDKFPQVYKKIQDADVVIFASPIWWGQYSSLIQKVIERLDEADVRVYKDPNKRSIGEGKVFGVAIVGAEDNAQNCINYLVGWASHLGFTNPPYNSITYLGTYGDFDEWAKESKYLELMAASINQCAQNIKPLAKDLF